MELGKKIRQLRLKANMTQDRLAQKLGISAQSVSKWENAVAMPDVTMLPMLAETFGVSIDELFDLTVEQRINRIENRLDIEDDLPAEVFNEYEDFLKAQLGVEKYKKRTTDLIAYLYWHRMNYYGKKASRYAKEGIRMAPNEKNSQWILNYTDGHARWDWNIKNHSAAIEFYSDIVKKHPNDKLPYMYLIDNLLADHRADEAEKLLERYCVIKDAHPIMKEVYRAYIALARFDKPTADGIMENIIDAHPDDSDCLFETAQYYAMNCDYDKAIDMYERAFDADKRRPRFRDALDGIADIYKIMGNKNMAAKTYDRIIELLQKEWGITESDDIKSLKTMQQALLENK